MRPTRTRIALATALVGALTLAGCSTTQTEPESSQTPTAAAAPVATTTPPVTPESTPEPTPQPEETTSVPAPPATGVMASELAAPWSVTFFGDTALLSERDSGRILELDGAGGNREIGVIDGVGARAEAGLLGITVHGDWLYAYYTAGGGENRIERFVLSGEPGALSIGSPGTIISGIPAAQFHNGGRLAFGPDGMLYATTGDATDTSTSQDLGSFAGKILRLTPEGAVPADNPFEGSYVYSYGHRNPQGIAWGTDGTMYASEFGQDTWDELNIITPGGNYGWPIVEGIAGADGYIDPVQQWSPSNASPSGIAVFGNSLFIANLRGERLREVPLADPSRSIEHLVGEYGRLRDVVVAPDGGLWIVTNNTDGRGNPTAEDDRVISLETQG